MNMDEILDAVVALLRKKFKGQTYVEYDGVTIVIRENDGSYKGLTE